MGLINLPDETSSQWFGWLLPICMLLIIGTFLIDVFVPLGVAGGVPYVAPVLLATFLPLKFALFTVGISCSLLTVGGMFYSPEIDIIDWKVFKKRGLALFTIWVTAILGYYQRQLRDQRESAYKRIRILEGIIPIWMDCKKTETELGFSTGWNSTFRCTQKRNFLTGIVQTVKKKF